MQRSTFMTPETRPGLAFGRMLAATITLAASIWPLAYAGAQERPADQLVLVSTSNLRSLHPALSLNLSSELGVVSHLYEALVIRGGDGEIRPSAASSWELLDDRTWRFNLKPENRFPNGELLDAEAVKWNIEQNLDESSKSPLRSLLLPVIESVEVVDPLTVDITTKSTYLPFLNIIGHVYIMPPEWASEPGRDLTIEAMGTGPYQLKAKLPGDSIAMEARPGFIGEPPAFGEVIVRIIPEASSRVAALLSGEVDFIMNIPFTDLDRINASGAGTAAVIPSTRTAFVHLNTLEGPLKDNVKLRQALNYAIDKQGIIDGLWRGSVTPSACQVIAESNFGHQKDLKPYEYSPEKAKQLLAEAGYPDGLTITLEIPTNRYLDGEEVTQIIAAQLEAVGVKANIQQSDFASWVRRYTSQQLDTASYASLGSITLDADLVLTSVTTGSYGYWDDQTMIDLLQEARHMPTQEERMDLYRKAAEWMCEQAPFVFLFEQPFLYATSDRVSWQVRNDEWLFAPDFGKP